MARLLAFAVLVSLCSEPPATRPEPTPTPPSPTEPSAPPPSLAGCDLSPPVTLLPPGHATSIAVSLTDAGGHVSAADGEALAVRRIGPQGAGMGAPFELSLSGSLHALAPLGDAVVAVTRSTCPESAHCLSARREGSPSTLSAALPGRLLTSRRATTGERLYLAWSAEGGSRGLETFLETGSLGRVRRQLGPEPPDPELPVEILGLSADADRWAVLWRRGAAEDERSRVFLTTDDSHEAVGALHEALVVEAMRLDGDQVELIVGFEMSRPHHVVVRRGAREPTTARELRGGEVPAAFRDRERGTLEIDEAGLWLGRRDALGDPLGPRTRVLDAVPRSAALARRAHAYLVVWLDREGSARARWARCQPPVSDSAAPAEDEAGASPRSPD